MTAAALFAGCAGSDESPPHLECDPVSAECDTNAPPPVDCDPVSAQCDTNAPPPVNCDPVSAEYCDADILSALRRLAADHASGCSTDEDCTLINVDTACQGLCPTAIAVAREESFMSALECFSSTCCSLYPEWPRGMPSCLLLAAICRDGVCEPQPVEP